MTAHSNQPDREGRQRRRNPRALAFGLLPLLAVAVVASTILTSAQPAVDPLAAINSVRERREDPSLTLDDRLSVLADEFALSMVSHRCACLSAIAQTHEIDAVLSAAVADALNSEVGQVRAGLTIAWDVTEESAVAAAVGRVGASGVLLSEDVTIAGVGSARVPDDVDWISRPMSGAGPDISLAGYTVVVIISAAVVPPR